MLSVTAPPPLSSPPLWIPVTDRDTGHTVLMLESVYRHFSARGPTLTLNLDLPPLAVGQPVAQDGEYTEPQKLDVWASMFGVSRNTMSSYFRTGNVRARKVGKLWCVLVGDIPSGATW